MITLFADFPRSPSGFSLSSHLTNDDMYVQERKKIEEKGKETHRYIEFLPGF